MKRTVLMRGKRHAFVVDYCELAVRSRDIVVPDGDSWLSWLFRYQHLRDFLPETFAEREHLKSAGVSHGRTAKCHEFPNSTRVLDDFLPRREIEVVRICNNSLHAHLRVHKRAEAFGRRLGCHGNKRGRLYVAVRRADNARTGKTGALLLYFKRNRALHVLLAAGNGATGFAKLHLARLHAYRRRLTRLRLVIVRLIVVFVESSAFHTNILSREGEHTDVALSALQKRDIMGEV